jgi:hypothetical protein
VQLEVVAHRGLLGMVVLVVVVVALVQVQGVHIVEGQILGLLEEVYGALVGDGP